MALDVEELEPIVDEVLERVRRDLLIANRTDTLDEYLKKLGFDDLLPLDYIESISYPNGMIVVLGESKASKEHLIGIGQACGLDKDRFEFCLSYEDAKSYPYQKLQYNAKYRVVLIGPIPYNTCSKGDFSSVITMMEKTPGYPRIVRLSCNGELKITKNCFKKVLSDLINEGYLARSI